MVTASLVVGCPAADDGDGEGGTAAGSSGTAAGSGSDDGPGSNPDTGSSGMASNSDSDTGNDVTGSSGMVDDDTATTTGETATTGDGSSDSASTGQPDATYPPCPEGAKDCPDEFPECMGAAVTPGGVGGISWCTAECQDASDCPEPTSGDPELVCRGGDKRGNPGVCMLNCSEGQTCPDGMQCAPFGGGMVCAWVSD